MTVYADDANGVWTADYKTVGFNITEDMWAGGHVNDGWRRYRGLTQGPGPQFGLPGVGVVRWQ
jgi:hypothetical protein